jgi:hypothetical protein
LSAGRMESYKQVEATIRAVASLDEQYVLRIAGDGPERQRLARIASDLGVCDRVEFMGRVDTATLYRWFRTAHVYVTMSTLESLGIAALEALASGARVVASDIPAHRYVAEASGGAMHVVPRDAPPDVLAGAIVDAANRPPVSKPQVMSWDVVVKKTLGVYRLACRTDMGERDDAASGGTVGPAHRDRTGIPPSAPWKGHDVSISVAISAYTEERWDVIAEAVRSIARQNRRPLETLLIVDNNPRLAERARRELTGVTVRENEDIRGASGARNTALRHACGDVVAFLDDDAAAADDWIERLTIGYREPGVLGVGGSIAPSWHDQRPAWFPPEFDWVIGCTYVGVPTGVAPVRNLILANMSVRRDVGCEIGFRCDLGPSRTENGGSNLPGNEETEFCIRAAARWPGWQWLFVPSAQVRHDVPRERSSWRYFAARCFGEGRAKARVVRLTGAANGLSSERDYVQRVLPRGAARGIQDAVVRGDLAGLGRSAAIVAGLAITTAGYLRGRYELARASRGGR